MTDRSEHSTGFFGSTLFKVMIAVLLAALGAYLAFRYIGKDDIAAEDGKSETLATESEPTEVAEATEMPVVESRTTYQYSEDGNTFILVDDGGPGPYEFTCAAIAKVETSSVLAPQGSSSYPAGNMTDMTESTAWSEGKDGLGIGEWIEFTLTDEYKKWGYTDEDFIANHFFGGFVIQTGYGKSPSLWKKNSRPIKLKAYLNGEPISVIQLQDSPDFQAFGIFPEQTDQPRLKEGDVIRFEIIDVVQGTNGMDACISEFHIEGNCG